VRAAMRAGMFVILYSIDVPQSLNEQEGVCSHGTSNPGPDAHRVSPACSRDTDGLGGWVRWKHVLPRGVVAWSGRGAKRQIEKSKRRCQRTKGSQALRREI
jgi:hypothetical protein